MKGFFKIGRRSVFIVVFVISIVITACSGNRQTEEKGLQIANEALKAEKEELQAKNETLQAAKEELQAKNEALQSEKEKLQKGKKQLEQDNCNLDKILKNQLSREIHLVKIGEVELCPIVGVASSLPLAGYLQKSKKLAKNVPMCLKSEYSSVFWKLDLKNTNIKKVGLSKKGKRLKLIPKKEQYLIPLSKKGIYYLELTLEIGTYYIALKWK